ncbi:MaoC family dehydratase [Bacillus solimangrovi]|uniref:Enoyl-CoA hydratase n=1 Tax=Bacillus solimangrovi TaxID=1305675 RepID=A0A1E5LCR4_9BACI|nr:MaoC/PaaZ C-terminal domain-containing protein [Bacillus solimangrovi]OEH91860.1 enoyl-CoA hydratase [Bacillus solimangrovi]
MLMNKMRKQGRKIDEISVGERLVLTEKVEDKDLLLYLGLTNDANPLYIQHDYASRTPMKQPLIPPVMLIGIITSAVSKYLPGPGSMIRSQQVSFPNPAYHYAKLEFEFEVLKVIEEDHLIVIGLNGKDDQDNVVIEGTMDVCPPHSFEPMAGRMLDNF